MLTTGILASSLALVHVLAGRLHFVRWIPRSGWLSFAGGTSIAYVFLHLLPELADVRAEHLESEHSAVPRWLEVPVFLTALLGLVAFYSLERMASKHLRNGSEEDAESAPSFLFWIHLGSFAVYNGMVGYLLSAKTESRGGVLLYFLAMALHFVTNDFALRHTHRAQYRHRGRWLLASAVMAGWVLGTVAVLDELSLDVLLAFLGGGIILNVLKEELPDERDSRLGAFALGVLGYGMLLLAI